MTTTKPSRRKFYRTVLTVEVLSEEPFSYNDLQDVYWSGSTGDCSLKIDDTVKNEVVDGPAMAKLLQAQASDPGFFQLTEDGADENDPDDDAG